MKTLYTLSPYVYSCSDVLVNFVNLRKEKRTAAMKQLLEFCITPKTKEQIIHAFNNTLFYNALDSWYLCETDKMYKIHKIDYVEIETINYCNYRCAYCPVRYTDVKKPEVMSMALFKKLLGVIQKNHIPNISLNFYNEPTLDPLFEQRIHAIGKTGLQLTLNTNASHLDEDKCQLLENYRKNIKIININIPSIDPSEYYRLTGSLLTARVSRNIDRIINGKCNTEIIMNGTASEVKNNMQQIKKKYKRPVYHNTNDRAGILKNKYDEHITIKGKLHGCPKALRSLIVFTDGTVTFCCSDYYRKHTIGNLNRQSYNQIMTGEKAIHYRKVIFGELEEDILCNHCSLMSFIASGKLYKQLRS